MSACRRCQREVVWPDYHHGREAVCGACYDIDTERRLASYDRSRAATMKRHPAGSRKRPIREWWLEPEFLAHTSHWKPVR